jgi:hypothetical protein
VSVGSPGQLQRVVLHLQVEETGGGGGPGRADHDKVVGGWGTTVCGGYNTPCYGSPNFSLITFIRSLIKH